MDKSDDDDVDYKGHFCSECSIPPHGGVRGWVFVGMGMGVLGFGKLDRGVSAAKITIGGV